MGADQCNYLRKEISRRRERIRVRERDDGPDDHLRVLPLLEGQREVKLFADDPRAISQSASPCDLLLREIGRAHV